MDARAFEDALVQIAREKGITVRALLGSLLSVAF